jgi:hypothetical protein
MTGFHLSHQTQAPRVMYINSADVVKHHENTTHFSYTFKEAIHTRDSEGMLVSLLSATVPYSFYNVRDGVNNKITYTVTDVAYESLNNAQVLNVAFQSYTIEEGNYTHAQLKSAIQTHFTPVGGVNLTIAFDEITRKFTFTNSSTKYLKMWTDYEDSPRIELGLTRGTHNVYPNVALKSQNVVDLNGAVHALFLRSNLPARGVFESETGGVSDVLGKISMNASPGGVITHSPSDSKHETLLFTNHVKSLTIKLTDERNRLLDLNGLHFQIGLLFRFVPLRPSDPAKPRAVPSSSDQNESQDMAPQGPKAKAKTKTDLKKQRRHRALKRGKVKVSQAMERAKADSAKADSAK